MAVRAAVLRLAVARLGACYQTAAAMPERLIGQACAGAGSGASTAAAAAVTAARQLTTSAAADESWASLRQSFTSIRAEVGT